MSQGMHKFGSDGIMLDPPVQTPENPEQPEEPEVLNGIVESNGKLYYYVNGKLTYAGLVQLQDENGVTFYIYVRSNGQLATGTYWPTKNNGLLPLKNYNFGADGRLYL
jgi:hypothetical protein